MESAEWKRAKVGKTDGLFCKPGHMLDTYPSCKFRGKLERIWYRGCEHNSIVSVKNRYLRGTKPVQTAKIDTVLLERAKTEFFQAIKKEFDRPLTLNEFLEQKSGRLRTRYYEACQKLMNNPNFKFTSIAQITAFIKKEIMPLDENGQLKVPRSIMGRDPRFNLLYGLYTTALEDAMMHLPQVTKGKTPKALGEAFRERILSETIGEGDCSKFEGSIRLFHLRWEDDLARFVLNDSEYRIFHACWVAKLRKKGHYLDGTPFDFWYCRGSGDMDTGLFNTMINWIMCRYFELVNNLGHQAFFVNGDDNLINLQGKRDLVDTFSILGFDCKFAVKTTVQSVEYCSGYFIEIKPGEYLYAHKLDKLLSNVFVIKNTQFQNCLGEYYATLGTMYKKIYGNVPIYSNLAELFLRSAAQSKHRFFNKRMYDELGIYHLAQATEDIECDVAQTLADISLASGYAFAELENIAEQLDSVLLPLDPANDKRYRKRGVKSEIDTALVNTVEGLLRKAATEFLENMPPIFRDYTAVSADDERSRS